MRLRVTQYGEPILREVGKPITCFDASLRELAHDMIDTMHDEDGAGLAAQQVDKALQLFVMDIGSDGKAVDFNYSLDGRTPPLPLIMPMIVCNPRITSLEQGTDSANEGCLSFPGMRLDGVERERAISMQYQDVEGVEHTLVCDGFLARCCLHEYDHLQGVLFIERVPKAQIHRYEKHLKRLKRDSRDFLKRMGKPTR